MAALLPEGGLFSGFDAFAKLLAPGCVHRLLTQKGLCWVLSHSSYCWTIACSWRWGVWPPPPPVFFVNNFFMLRVGKKGEKI